MQEIQLIGYFFENRLHWQFVWHDCKHAQPRESRTIQNKSGGEEGAGIWVMTADDEFGNSLSNLGNIYSMYLRLNLPTTPDLKF
jgi:hypothetical protein